jgi:hypothetical protein
VILRVLRRPLAKFLGTIPPVFEIVFCRLWYELNELKGKKVIP